MGYKADPKTNTEFFGKKTAQKLIKHDDIPDSIKQEPKSVIKRLVYWRWDWRGPGGYKIGKLEGSSSMYRQSLTLDCVIHRYANKADGRFFQTGYDKSPAELMTECITVGDVVKTFIPDEIELNEGDTEKPSEIQPSA